MPGLPPTPLYAIVDADRSLARGLDPAALGVAWIAAGARLVQLRAKGTGSGRLLAWCDELAAAARRAGATFIVNDRADLALLSGATGVHVGADDLPVADARVLLGPDAVIGLSTHSSEQVTAALDEPISYLAVGPVFGTASKETGYAPVGLELVRQAARRASVPVVAIGGITLDRAQAVLDAGAHAVAVIGDLLTGEPTARVRRFLDELRSPAETRAGRPERP